MCPCGVATGFYFKDIQIQSSEFSAQRQMLYAVAMFWLVGLCQVCVLNLK